MNITQTLLQNPSFRLDVRKGEFTANDLLNMHCHDWEKKPSVRRVREVVAVARELDGATVSYTYPGPLTGCFGPVATDFACVTHEPSPELVEQIKYLVSTKGITPKFSIPQSTQPVADDFLKLSGDFAIISDLHVPYHSSKTIEKFLDTAYSANIRKFLIIGDMNDCGQFHPKRGDLQHHSHRYQDDLDLNKVIYAEFMKCFPDGGYVLSGNHDQWFIQNMKGELDTDWTYSKFFHELPLIKFSNFEQCQVTSGNKVIRALHGANYSAANALGMTQKLSAKFECGIVAGHQHNSASGWSYSGKHQCVALGGAYELNRLHYLHHSPKTNPTPTNGFALLKEGRIQNFDFQDDMR